MGVYRDDPSIKDDEGLWRNIPPWHLVRDDTSGTIRISSAAFDDDKDGSPMSVSLAEVVLQHGRNPEDLIRSLPDFALAAITAEVARGCNQGVIRDPTPQNPAHALVFGDKKRKRVRRRLAKAAEWVIPPPDRVAWELMT